jgi:hypothetical protein
MQFLNSFISYHTLCPLRVKTSFSIIVLFLEFRYLNSRNILNPEKVTSQIFQVNDLLLYTHACTGPRAHTHIHTHTLSEHKGKQLQKNNFNKTSKNCVHAGL